MSQTLAGKVAIVAGATRGAGRGIAHMLGEKGAIVYCTGRTSRDEPNKSGHPGTGRPETIEETAELVNSAGGTGISVCVDHQDQAQVVELFDRIEREQQRLDVLATVMTGQPASWTPFLDDTPSDGKTFIDSWIWPRLVTAWHAAKQMASNQSGLIVELVEQDNVGYHGAFYFDLMETLLKRLIFGFANELGKSGIAAVAVAPGFMRTEAILEGYGVTESNWRDALANPQAAAQGWGGSESPCFVGRAIAAMAADPHIMQRNGGIYTARSLSEEYGFTDVDGSLPDHAVLEAAFAQAKQTFLAPMLEAAKLVPHDWKQISKTEDAS